MKAGTKEMRSVYVDTLMSLAEKDPNVVVLEADLAGSIGTGKFAGIYPKQFVNCGIMEANMMGVAAGLSLAGKHPFIHTFAAFSSRRAFDQIFISLAYARLNATILGSDSGIASEFNGGTHMSFEDLAIMRTLPNAIITEASDEIMLEKLLRMSYEKKGLWYIRMSRKLRPMLYDPQTTVAIGKGQVLKTGGDLAIFCSGVTAAESLEAAVLLAEKGVDAAVIDMPFLKPFDRALVENHLSQVKGILTVENHQTEGALGSAVAEVIAESGKGTHFKRLGVQNRYGQVGDFSYLMKEYGFDREAIVAASLSLLQA